MTEQSQRRAPVPVAAAALLVLLAAAGAVWGAVSSSGPSMLLGLLVGLLFLALAWGLWRGSGRARFWTTFFLTAQVVYAVVGLVELDAPGLIGIAVAGGAVGLLLVPRASRRWFDGPLAEA